MMMMSDDAFELMQAHLEEPRQDRLRRRGYLRWTWHSGCVVVGDTKCTTLAALRAATDAVAGRCATVRP